MKTATLTNSKSQLTLAALLLATWATATYFFYAPTAPLSEHEIDNYMEGVQRLLTESFVMPEGSGMDERGLEGAMGDLRRMAERDDGKAIYMVNLMKWRQGELVAPPGFTVPDAAVNAREADRLYNEGLFWTLLANNSHTAYLARSEPNAFNYGTSAEADGWGEIGIFRYNSRRDFFNMITSDDYLSIMYLKLLSMGAIAITPSQPHGLLFNPMPNMPVTLFFAMTIAYLAFLIICLRTQRTH